MFLTKFDINLNILNLLLVTTPKIKLKIKHTSSLDDLSCRGGVAGEA